MLALEPNHAGNRQSPEELEQRELLLAVKTLLEVRERMQGSGTKGRLQ